MLGQSTRWSGSAGYHRSNALTIWVFTCTARPSSTSPMRTVAAASRASWSFKCRRLGPLVSSPRERANAVIDPSTSTTGFFVRTASLARWISTSRGFSP
ncbi:hypothetical protein ETAA1_38520 [Urbifossiella limnaea]|uniref:Uncharacterized protein n=1 Tax=Urbifossiella limnaea TaxID=2528023 RepID=A0A517XWI6_9BACT|nr:hypothetical protein ETAA1_38520 [Urbifossiella limnaea]